MAFKNKMMAVFLTDVSIWGHKQEIIDVPDQRGVLESDGSEVLL